MRSRASFEIERRQRMRRIAHDFHGSSARAEHEERSKRLVHRHAEDQLVRARSPDHRLHREPLDARARLAARDPLQHVGRRLLRLCGALQSEPHAADIGFMADVVGKDLHHASAVLRDEAGRQCADFGGIAGNLRRNGGDAVSDEQLLGFHFRENRAPGSNRRLIVTSAFALSSSKSAGSDGGVRISSSWARA